MEVKSSKGNNYDLILKNGIKSLCQEHRDFMPFFKIGSYHVLWPIPQDVIDDNQGGVINQNKGYPGYENNIPPKTEITEED